MSAEERIFQRLLAAFGGSSNKDEFTRQVGDFQPEFRSPFERQQPRRPQQGLVLEPPQEVVFKEPEFRDPEVGDQNANKSEADAEGGGGDVLIEGGDEPQQTVLQPPAQEPTAPTEDTTQQQGQEPLAQPGQTTPETQGQSEVLKPKPSSLSETDQLKRAGYFAEQGRQDFRDRFHAKQHDKAERERGAFARKETDQEKQTKLQSEILDVLLNTEAGRLLLTERRQDEMRSRLLQEELAREPNQQQVKVGEIRYDTAQLKRAAFPQTETLRTVRESRQFRAVSNNQSAN